MRVLCRGRVIKGQEVTIRSRYEEDLFTNNHTSVWGSFWEGGAWGYACCKSHVKNSMCMGVKAGVVAAANVRIMAENAARKDADAALLRGAAAAAQEEAGTASASGVCSITCVYSAANVRVMADNAAREDAELLRDAAAAAQEESGTASASGVYSMSMVCILYSVECAFFLCVLPLSCVRSACCSSRAI